jgi:hypothetical protein
MQETVDAIYAILSVVSHEGSTAVEAGGQQAAMPFLSMGHCSRFLELLRLVQGTGQAGETMNRMRPEIGTSG